MRIPFGCEAEYRGQAPEGKFTNQETGEVVEYGPKLRFEVDLPDGDVETITIRLKQLDDVSDFDAGKLKKGERVFLEGVVEEASWEGRTRIRVRVLGARRAKGLGSVAA